MNYRQLDVYKRSYNLAKEIHKLSLGLPKQLQFDLGSQIRRCSRSIPSNIAEGFARNQSHKDLVSFLNISLGSNDEMLFNLDFMHDLELIETKFYTKLKNDYTICGKQLYRLIQSKKPGTRP